MKKLVASFFRNLGYEVRRIAGDPGLIQFLDSRQVDLILDVGANTGQFGRMLRVQGYRGAILSFEPVREVFEELQRRIDVDPKWSAQCLALGDKPGRSTINISRDSLFSSMVGQTELAVRFDRDAQVVRSEEVGVACLDDYLAKIEGQNAFLKIDSQGFEKQILDGGARVLNLVKGVLIEVPIVPLYAGTWRLEEVVSYMRVRGLVLAQIKPVNYLKHADAVSLLEIDCLFRREDVWDK